jgi:acyl-lipid omega-6 desaturase (Delta-12 desaturase)
MEMLCDNQSKYNRSWERIVLNYTKPVLVKSIWQICNSVIPYVLIWYLMYKSLAYPYLVTLLLSLLASGFLIRLFIIFHDCGHSSFFRSKSANRVIGMVLGIIAFTPFNSWHHQHSVHHATAGNLDKRGIGDVLTLTVDEYLKSSKWKRFIYRSTRNPFILFTLGPVIVVLIKNRLTNKTMTPMAKLNIYFTNISILLIAVIISIFIGLKAYLLIQVPIIFFSHSIGIWLFYIQHQFDDVSWDRGENWDYKTAALTGCSFLKLPPVLQWFTGNIGFHHIHHLSSRIPNYNLSRCHYENEIFKDVRPVFLSSTFKALTMSLWDEAERRLISFKKLKSGHYSYSRLS